ncbi:MAG: endolytic transglycosylase MltG, partial [Anaerolineae bacterium]|nr:endolytic transglycosylase MltG [Anaerolineae bacterium]
DQQVLVSSVFHNRLKSGRGLGATVTTEYALGHPGDWWPNAAGYVSTYDSPYNTNLYTGLPPSPIASPSIEAIRAAVSPASTNYLFFTANCNGPGNAYAETYDQHLANVNCD